MLYEIAIADAYGAGFEFAAPEVIAQHNDLSCYVPHQLYGMLGNYTDEKQRCCGSVSGFDCAALRIES